MPIKLPKELPARRTLEAEGIEVVDSVVSRRREMPPVRIALLNLMPQKSPTEAQIARLLGSTAYHIELTLIVPDSYSSKSTPAEHMAAFYQPWSRVRHRKFDGLIVTGAPVETLAFEQVKYWRELTEIFDWSQSHVSRAYYICWAAQAALYHFHGVPKHELEAKMFGVFRHRVLRADRPLLRGFDSEFLVPVSRRTEVRSEDLPRQCGLEVLADSPDSGLCLVEDRQRAAVYMFNHLEYDAETLKNEYFRDLDAGRAIGIPRNYFPGDSPDRPPVNRWRSHAQLLFRNWLDEIALGVQTEFANSLLMQWLLARDAKPSLVGEKSSDFLISAADDLSTLPAVLRWFAAFELSPKAVKVHRQGESGVVIELRFDRVADPTVERIARTLLLNVAEIRRVAYRNTEGTGGILAAQQEGKRLRPAAVSEDGAPVSVNATAA